MRIKKYSEIEAHALDLGVRTNILTFTRRSAADPRDTPTAGPNSFHTSVRCEYCHMVNANRALIRGRGVSQKRCRAQGSFRTVLRDQQLIRSFEFGEY